MAHRDVLLRSARNPRCYASTFSLADHQTMRLALIASAQYPHCAQLPQRASFAEGGNAVLERFTRTDAHYSIHQVLADSQLPERIARLMARHPRATELLIYCSGYLGAAPDGNPALLLEGTPPTALRVSDLLGITSADSTLLVLDGVLGSSAPTAENQPGQEWFCDTCVAEAKRRPATSLLAYCAPWESPDSDGLPRGAKELLSTTALLDAARDRRTRVTAAWASAALENVPPPHPLHRSLSVAPEDFSLLPSASELTRVRQAVSSPPEPLPTSEHLAPSEGRTERPTDAPSVPAPVAATPSTSELPPAPSPPPAAVTHLSSLPPAPPPEPEVQGLPVTLSPPPSQQEVGAAPAATRTPATADSARDATAELQPAQGEPHQQTAEMASPTGDAPTYATATGTPSTARPREAASGTPQLVRGAPQGETATTTEAAAPDVTQQRTEAAHQIAIGQVNEGLELLITAEKQAEGSERVEVHLELAKGYVLAEQPHHSIDLLGGILEHTPSHEEAGRLFRELLLAAGHYSRLSTYLTQRAQSLSGQAASRAWLEAVELWLGPGADPGKALGCSQQWCDSQPEEPGAWRQRSELAEKLGEYEQAIASRRSWATTVEDAQAAEVLTQAAELATTHLQDKNQSFELAEEALNRDPGNTRAFELAEDHLAGRKDPASVAALYERQLEHCAAGEAGERLAQELATLYSTRLRRPEHAVRALRRGIALSPESLELRHRLIDQLERCGDPGGAITAVREALTTQPLAAHTYRQASGILFRGGDVDGAWHASSALVILGHATARERSFAEGSGPEGLPAASRTLLAEDWQREGLLPAKDATLCRLLELVAPLAVPIKRARLRRKPEGPQPDAERLWDSNQSTSPLSRTLLWTSRLLNVPTPPLYVGNYDQLLRTGQQEEPMLYADSALTEGLASPELAFLWGRELQYSLPEFAVARFFPTRDDVLGLVQATLCLAGWAESGALEGEAKYLYKKMRWKAGSIKPALSETIEQSSIPQTHTFPTETIDQWQTSTALGGARLGLLACGNLQTAARMTECHPVEGLPRAVQLADLLSFSLSPVYGQLRRQLGVALHLEDSPSEVLSAVSA